MTRVIHAEGLVKRFGSVTALDGFDLDVEEGTVVGLLGPNGAGKTTTVRILTTLLAPDEGNAWVAGVDVLVDPHGVREQLGLSGQYAAVDEQLTGFENLVMVGRLYNLGRNRARARAGELLDRFALSDAADRPAKTYSGGMRGRLDLAGALIAEPPVLVLDEPTTGLDPRVRIQMWQLIRELVEGGTTLLLTTQYMEEADQLANEIVVIDQGHAIARGTAQQLKQRIGGERIELVVAPESDLATVRRVMASVTGGEVASNELTRTLTASADEGPTALMYVLRQLHERQIVLIDAALRRPTLDDVFLSLTGHGVDSITTSNSQDSEEVVR